MNFLFRNTKWFGTENNKIEADVFLSSSPVYTRQVPKHPVQGRTQVSDNIVKDPVVITIVGIISNTPLIGIPIPIQVRNDQVKILYQKLLNLHEDTSDKTIISIVDGDRRYKDMTLIRLELPKNPDDGASLRFSATFQELEIVDKEFVDIENIKEVNGSKSDMAESKDKGSVSKEDAVKKTALKAFSDNLVQKYKGLFN